VGFQDVSAGIKPFFDAPVVASNETGIRISYFLNGKQSFFAGKVNHPVRHLSERCLPCLVK